MLDLLDPLQVLLLEFLQSEPHAIQEVGIVEVPQRHHKGDVEDDLLQVFSPIQGIVVVPCLGDFVEERKKVENKRVPHEVHIEGSPFEVLVVNEVEEGGGVSADIGEGKKCVAKDEEEQFGC